MHRNDEPMAGEAMEARAGRPVVGRRRGEPGLGRVGHEPRDPRVRAQARHAQRRGERLPAATGRNAAARVEEDDARGLRALPGARRARRPHGDRSLRGGESRPSSSPCCPRCSSSSRACCATSIPASTSSSRASTARNPPRAASCSLIKTERAGGCRSCLSRGLRARTFGFDQEGSQRETLRSGRAHCSVADRRLSGRIRAQLSGERSDLRSARFVPLPPRKAPGRPKLSSLTSFGRKARTQSAASSRYPRSALFGRNA